MDCSKYSEILSAYLDDLLEEDQKLELEMHFKECPQCREELMELQETISLIHGLAKEELIPPASMRRGLREKLLQTQSKPKKKKHFALNKLQVWLPLGAAALFLLIITPMALNFNFGMSKSAAPHDTFNYSMSEGSQENFITGGLNQEFEGIANAPAKLRDVAQEDIAQKIIKTGYLNLEVSDYKEVTASLKEMVQSWGGYILNEESYTFGVDQKLLAGNISLRLPQAKFEEALGAFEELGNVRNRSANGQDVTEEYIDTEARLRAIRLKEERLIELLAKSGSLGDVLAVENELAQTRANLEALEGRLRYLNNRTDFSTINLELRETLTSSKKISTTGFRGILDRTGQAFIKTINTLITGFGNLIVFLGGNLPYFVLGLGFLGSGWVILKKHRKKE